MDFDVAIIGGGPGGSTLGGMIRRYDSNARVLIVEREKFPRDHVGESQLPQIGSVLAELGVWDEVEGAGFPVKIGATYRWGGGGELWNFNFVTPENYAGHQRPGPYQGIRKETAFQVDRAVYDQILLRHAQRLGCQVKEEVAVREIQRAGDRIEGILLSDGQTVRAHYYIDATGHSGFLRRQMGVEVECPTRLKNIAVWDYWTDTAWADTIGKGGTRVQVISVGYGWLWFIPVSPTRTSIGLICPAAYYKESGKDPEQLYQQGIADADRIAALVSSATRENDLKTTNDWSFVASRLYGENWFLVGESAGFADPILAAGLTLTQVGAKELAYTLLALLRGEHQPEWLKASYSDNQIKRIRQHMRFAEFWYSSNGLFTDLQDHCQEIALEAGLSMNPQQAWAWLAQGGFTHDIVGQVGVAGFDLSSMNQVTQRFLDQDIPWMTQGKNVFKLNLTGAVKRTIPDYQQGKIIPVECFERNGKRLPLTGLTLLLCSVLQQRQDISGILHSLMKTLQQQKMLEERDFIVKHLLQILEVLANEGWVDAVHDPQLPKLGIATPREGPSIHTHQQNVTSGSRH
jgi:flavin-dependent dehydrogenase